MITNYERASSCLRFLERMEGKHPHLFTQPPPALPRQLRAPRTPRHPTIADGMKMLTLRSQGMKLVAIGEETGFSKTTVSRILRGEYGPLADEPQIQ